MPAKSQAQQKFMGIVHAIQKGDAKPSEFSKDAQQAAKEMKPSDAKDFASTKHAGLPKKVGKEGIEAKLKETIRQTYRESLRESIDEDATELPQATIPSSVKVKLQMAIDRIKDSKLSNNAKLQLVAQVVDAIGVDKSQLSNIANKIRSKMESVNEAKIEPKDDWGVRLVVAINNNVSALHTSIIREKEDVKQAVEAFGNVLKNAIKETLKHKYKPHPKAKDADVKIKTFISELKKFENIVDMVIAKPTKVGVTKLDDAWRTIWNHKYGAEMALSGDLFDSIIEGDLDEVKYPTDLKVGSVILGQGFTRLKGVDGGKYYKIVDMDDTTATLVPSDKSGNVKGSSKVRHKLDSIEGGIKTAKRGDENGIVVIKESVNEAVSHEAMGIASMTNTRKEAVQKFIDDNNLDAKEILKVVTKGGLVERVRFIQALVGTPGNSSFKWYVKTYTNEAVVKESDEPSDIIKDLDKLRNDLIKKVEVLIAKKKKLYSDVDITTPMSADEKQLDKDIQSIFSQIQQIIQQKRKINK